MVLSVSRQVAAAPGVPTGSEELESRLHTITEHLLQKQQQVETLTSEKAFLQLKLETLTQQAQQAQQALQVRP